MFSWLFGKKKKIGLTKEEHELEKKDKEIVNLAKTLNIRIVKFQLKKFSQMRERSINLNTGHL